MVSPTPHQSNPHAVRRSRSDRRSPGARAATLCSGTGYAWPLGGGQRLQESSSGSSGALRPDCRDRRIAARDRRTASPTLTEIPHDPLKTPPKYKRRI